MYNAVYSKMATFSLPPVPVINIEPLLLKGSSNDQRQEVVREIGAACRNIGFFYIVGHHVDLQLQEDLDNLSNKFFAMPLEQKCKIAMKYGGKAWRGYFPVGDENTSGIPDQKEGIYLGTELPKEDEKLLHGPNLWPEFENETDTAAFREAITKYMAAMRGLGYVLMSAIAESLGIHFDAFHDMFARPTELFRIFNYPPHDSKFGEASLGVGEHTDYGFITLLRQDSSGGLQVKRIIPSSDSSPPPPSSSSTSTDCSKFEIFWDNVPPIPNSFVINLGDALEGITGGLLRATPHRVIQRTRATANRLSFPYFYDPNFESEMINLVDSLSEDDRAVAERNRRLVSTRWDKADPTKFQGKYGDYLSNKVARVFPDLFRQVA